jgi:glutaconate CoA-transferase subunit A
MSFHLDADKLVDLDKAVGAVADGAIVALGGGLSARLPMALVRELIRQGRRDLHVVGSAHGIDVDLLVAAGAIAVCEESYVGFEQDLGLAPAYRRALETGAVHAGAGREGLRYSPAPPRVRGGDLSVHRRDLGGCAAIAS